MSLFRGGLDSCTDLIFSISTPIPNLGEIKTPAKRALIHVSAERLRLELRSRNRLQISNLLHYHSATSPLKIPTRKNDYKIGVQIYAILLDLEEKTSLFVKSSKNSS